MNYLAIIDEETDYRIELKESILRILKDNYKNWDIIDIQPFKELENYISWINENDIRVLLVDQFLSGKSIKDGVHVNYLGSELVKYLRNYFKDLPIYAIAAVIVDDNLKHSLKSYDLIISKTDLHNNEESYVNLFIRSGESFYKENEKELTQLGDLSSKVAKGEATSDEIKILKTLQTALSLPYYADSILMREEHIKEREEDIKRLEDLKEQIGKILNKEQK